jgi:hypothetical protein
MVVNTAKVAYVSWFGGKGIGLYIYKLIAYICKDKNRSIIIGTSAWSDDCESSVDTCELKIKYNKTMDIFDPNNPYSTIDEKTPSINCKLNRLYLNYGYYFSDIKCMGPTDKYCTWWGYVDRIDYIVDSYLKHNMRANTSDSLLQLANLIRMTGGSSKKLSEWQLFLKKNKGKYKSMSELSKKYKQLQKSNKKSNTAKGKTGGQNKYKTKKIKY